MAPTTRPQCSQLVAWGTEGVPAASFLEEDGPAAVSANVVTQTATIAAAPAKPNRDPGTVS